MQKNERNFEKAKNKQQGITLIALVITIIVLMILTGISLNAVIGENGIITQAQNAKIENERASIEEKIQMEYAGAYGTNKVDAEKLKEGLTNQGATFVLESGNGVIATFDETTYYVDENGDVSVFDKELAAQNKANAPKLSAGMIPVKYDGTNWVVCSETDETWYNYSQTDKKWANVMLSDGKYDTSVSVGTVISNDELGSMFVWIPRYAYKITSGYKEQKGAIDILWLNGNGYGYVENGEIKSVAKEPKLNGNAYTDYVVHPCFKNGNGSYKNGEWDKELSGIWVSKFEAAYPMSGKENDNKAAKTIAVNGTDKYYPVFKGQRYSYNYVAMSDIYTLSQSLDGNLNPYGLNTSADSHFLKNSEWGAVAYLSYSIYGTGNNNEETEMSLNNVNLNGKATSVAGSGVWGVTGYAGEHEASETNAMATNTFSTNPGELTEELSNGTVTSYAWYTTKGQKASTTGNIYGIYDLVGGNWDYTASYVDYDKSKATYLTTYGSNFTNLGSTKYMTAYRANPDATNYSVNESFKEWTLGNGYFGDGIFEVSTATNLTASTFCAWYGDWQEADITSQEPFFLRGGAYYLTAAAGAFYLADTPGNATYYTRVPRCVGCGVAL